MIQYWKIGVIKVDVLSKCILFNGIDKEVALQLINETGFIRSSYKSGDFIAMEGDPCDHLSIILEGEIEIHKPFSSGKVVTISHFKAGDVFAESLVFSDKKEYPATVVSTTDSIILMIPRSELIVMLAKNSRVLENFAGVLSKRIHMLNDRITNLSFDTTRKKVVNILLLEYGRQKSKYIALPYSRKKMAELINIPRPSLSRELIRMKEEGLIDFYKNRFKIVDIKALERILQH